MSPEFKSSCERLKHFDGPIALAAMRNTAIAVIVHQYAAGQIVTKEEALCQMVLALSAQAEEWKEIALKQFELGAPLFSFPPEP